MERSAIKRIVSFQPEFDLVMCGLVTTLSTFVHNLVTSDHA